MLFSVFNFNQYNKYKDETFLLITSISNLGSHHAKAIAGDGSREYTPALSAPTTGRNPAGSNGMYYTRGVSSAVVNGVLHIFSGMRPRRPTIAKLEGCLFTKIPGLFLRVRDTARNGGAQAIDGGSKG